MRSCGSSYFNIYGLLVILVKVRVNECPAGLENWSARLEPDEGTRNRKKATVKI